LPPLRQFELGAYVSGVAFTRDGALLAAATGAGEIRFFDVAGEGTRSVKPHRGAILSFAAHPDGVSFLSGGDDGRIVRTTRDGASEQLGEIKGRWIEVLATHKTGAFACVAGKDVKLWAPGEAEPATLGPHPSTVSAIDFSPDGSRIVAAHYGGVSIWQVKRPAEKPRTLNWKGSHIQVKYAPNGKFLATTTQDNAIHVWRLSTGQDMQMAGYRVKVRQLVFTANSRWLLSDAADCFVAWDFSGKGPEGQPPLEFGFGDGATMTGIAGHPEAPFLIGGFENGAIRLGDLDGKRELTLREPDDDAKPVRSIAFSPDGWHAAAGSEDGRLAMFSLKPKG
jgi:WD40 repeat protein